MVFLPLNSRCMTLLTRKNALCIQSLSSCTTTHDTSAVGRVAELRYCHTTSAVIPGCWQEDLRWGRSWVWECHFHWRMIQRRLSARAMPSAPAWRCRSALFWLGCSGSSGNNARVRAAVWMMLEWNRSRPADGTSALTRNVAQPRMQYRTHGMASQARLILVSLMHFAYLHAPKELTPPPRQS